MKIRTTPINQIPDLELIKDELTKEYSRDLADILTKTIRNIYDDLVSLEKEERVTSFPTANLASRGKCILLEGTGGGADELYICADTGGAGYTWKTIALS